jgi:HEAT repeat protein
MKKKDRENLMKKLENEDFNLRIEAVEVLGNMEDDEAFELLIQTFNDENPQVRLLAAKTMGEMGKPAVDPLIQALKVDDGNTRKYAVYALKNMGESGVVEHLIPALKDPDWGVRKFSAKALGDRQDKEAVEPLIETLNDDDWGVRVAATKALGDIGDGRAIDPIKKARRNATGDKEFKKVANKALKKIQ